VSADVYAQWLGVALLALAFAAAIGVMLARSLFALCMHVFTTGVAIAAFVALVGDADAGLVTAAAVIAASVLMIWGVTLTARAVKASPLPGSGIVRVLGSLGAGALLIAMAAPQVALPAPAPHQGGEPQIAVWIAPLMLTLAVACLGLLGFGERGALEPAEKDR
jgi:uncharacterized membrane protein